MGTGDCCDFNDEKEILGLDTHLKDAIAFSMALLNGTTKSFFLSHNLELTDKISGSQIMAMLKIMCAILVPACSLINANQITEQQINDELAKTTPPTFN